MVKIICLSGGPVAGKTTALHHLKRSLKERTGWDILTIEDLLKKRQANNSTSNPVAAIGEQRKGELIALSRAYNSPAKNTVIVTDRGIYDAVPYHDESQYINTYYRAMRQLWGSESLANFESALKNHYDAVIHMVSFAGTEVFPPGWTYQRKSVTFGTFSDGLTSMASYRPLTDDVPLTCELCKKWERRALQANRHASNLLIVDNQDIKNKSARVLDMVAGILERS